MPLPSLSEEEILSNLCTGALTATPNVSVSLAPLSAVSEIKRSPTLAKFKM